MSIEFERDGKRWVLTAEHVEDNADNRDADAEDMALAGVAALEKYAQLEDALIWLDSCTVSFCDLDTFLAEVRELGWGPGAGAKKVAASEMSKLLSGEEFADLLDRECVSCEGHCFLENVATALIEARDAARDNAAKLAVLEELAQRALLDKVVCGNWEQALKKAHAAMVAKYAPNGT